MSIFVDCTRENFLKNYWQQQPLLLRASIIDLVGVVDSGDLAGIACEPDSETRIISGFGLNNNWSCEQGPFTEQQLSAMPNKNWTLLVQGLDQWIEEVHAILERFSFLPKWRLEDVMASFAPVGGGVGPHFDYYDVFLLQVSGTREWQLGQVCDDATRLQENSPVKLLKEFERVQTLIATPGDMLYVPAGVGHWGTAVTDECITLSVGFRAPSQQELLFATLETLIEEFAETGSNNLRYRDCATSIEKDSVDASPYKIHVDVEHQLLMMTRQLTPEAIRQAINKSFGSLVTEPRHLPPLDDDHTTDSNELTLAAINCYIDSNSGFELVHPHHSRFAFSEQALFVNGVAFNVRESFAKELCSGLLETPINAGEREVLLTLLATADIELAD
ncbi:MAG: 50S ribosomal protein L16 3-hydroxylase [Pseudohongiellaceae bacterium]